MTTATRASVKKPYSSPTLSLYGSLVALTTAVSMSGTNKDGGPNNTKST